MKKFFENTAGNVATSTAILIVPLLLAAGSAVDYSQYARKQSSLQGAMDAAVLSIAPDILRKSHAALTEQAKDYLRANLSEEQFSEIQDVTLEQTDNGERYQLTVSAAHPTGLMQIAGITELTYSPTVAVRLPSGDYEIALVLDSTRSMNLDGKIGALKSNATNFVNTLTELNTNEPRIQMSVVPFAKYVNVGLNNRDAQWLDAPEDTTENICTMQEPIISRSGCSDQTVYRDGVPVQREVCTNIVYGDPVEMCEQVENKWNGCVGSRPSPLNIEDRSYNTRVPGLLNKTCSAAVTPLTDSKSTLLDAINELQPSGDTYIPAGLTWGLRTLSSNTPFTGGATYADAASAGTKKILILMSDGENVSSVSTDDRRLHTGTNVTQANNVTARLCDEIKSNQIKVFTIGFGAGISGQVEELLKNCSTNNRNYYRAADADKLAAAFESIANSIVSAYLSE